MRVAARQAQFHAQPLALLAAAYAAGVLLAHASAPALRWALAGGALCFVMAAVALVGRRLTCATLFMCAAFVCAGLALSLVEQRSTGADRVRRLYDNGLIGAGEPLEVTGVLARAPEVAPDGFYLALNIEQLKRRTQDITATGMLELFAPARDAATRAAYDELELRRGARVRVLVALEREEAFRNPGGSALTEFLARRGFDAVGVIKSPQLIERLDDERVLLPLVWLDAWREWMRARMAQMFSVETAGVLQAALLGNRYGLSRATAERFRAGGTFHVLVISGLHISFIAWLAFTLLRFVTRRRAWQFAATVLLLWAYAVAVGAGASVVRAALMFTLVALAPLVSRRADSLNVLGGVALALLIWRPDDLFDPSFQLTFMSVLGIITLGWPLLERLREVGAWRPTRATPYPPACSRWFRVLGELLYWRESVWRREQTRTIYSYRLFKNPLAARLERWHVQWLLRHACAAVLISASVQLCLLPLLIIYFHRVSAAALVLNIFVGVLMAALALSALMALALSCVSLRLTQPFVGLGERLNWLMTHSIDPFARTHIASLRLPAYHDRAALIYVLYYITLVVMLIMLARWQPLAPPVEGEVRPTTATDERRALGGRNRHKTTRRLTLAGLTLIALLSVIITHPLSAGRADGRLRIDFLDVGQGDATLVTMPDGTTLLVDSGGQPQIIQPKRQLADRRASPPPDNDLSMANGDEPAESFARDARSIGDAVVSEYLWWRGLDHIDYLIATHAHADHIDGLNDVAHNFAVRAAFVARTPARSDEYARLAATLRETRVPLYLLGRGAQLRFGEVTADVLWPMPDASTTAPSGNDDSLVLRLRYKERVFLLTGDIESHAESELVRAQDNLRCDVVKVGHHGSRTSSTTAFVNVTRPQVAVISVGRTSPFGHPDARVVARWQAAGAQVLQTGRRGTITVSTDGRDLRVETYVPD